MSNIYKSYLVAVLCFTVLAIVLMPFLYFTTAWSIADSQVSQHSCTTKNAFSKNKNCYLLEQVTVSNIRKIHVQYKTKTEEVKMYYEIGEIIRKNIHVNGFDFKLFILKGHMGISIQIKDMNNVPIKHAYVADENDLDMASDLFNQAIDEWIEENTDEQDRLINLVMKW